MALIGSVKDFDPNTDSWGSMEERLQHYMSANDIADGKQVVVVLTVLGARAYDTLKDLISSKKLAECPLDELVGALRDHYQPKPLEIAERFWFYSRRQEPGEDLKSSVVGLKKLAAPVDLRIIRMDRICEDNISTSKNREAALCCEKENLERGLCFKNLQNMPPVQLPVIGRHFSYEEECLAFAANDHVLVESYIHGLARRLTRFPLQMLSRISYAYILLYATCCAQSGHLKGCFSPKKEEFLAEVKKEIENENRICKESKQGDVDSSIRAVIFYAKKKPSDSWERAVEFGGGYDSFASNCCRPKFITSDCFQKQSDVLLDRFCTLPTIGPQKVCCLKRESEKLDCLAQLALEESSTIPYASLQFDRLCDLTRNSQVQVLSWSAYEYSRRHTDTSTDAILNNSSDIRKAVNHCCAQNDTFACFPGVSMYFK